MLSWPEISTTRECPESTISVSPFGRRLANAAVFSPWSYCQTMSPWWLTSITLLLPWSAIRKSPLDRSWTEFGLLSVPGPELGPYDQSICFVVKFTSITRLFPWSTIMMSLFGSCIAKTGTSSRSGPEPLIPACPYCHVICPCWLTMMTRLSTQGGTGDPVGIPDPLMSVNPPANRSASLGPITEPGPGLHNDPFPEPKLQTIWSVNGSTSMTRSLYWSDMSRLPAVSNAPPEGNLTL